MIGSRTSFAGESMKRLAGSTLVGEAHESLPVSYMIVEIIYGNTLPNGRQGNRDDLPKSALTTCLTRAGSDRIRVCMFHLNNVVAASKTALAHEALRTMFADCLPTKSTSVLSQSTGCFRKQSASSEADCSDPDWSTFGRSL